MTGYDNEEFFELREKPLNIFGIATESSKAPLTISFEMNKDKQLLQRSHYSSLDFLSDIGGMQGLLLSIFGYFIAVLNSQNSEEWLVSNLFKFRPKEKSSGG